MRILIDRDEPPDHIVIETSGLALPKPLIKAFEWPEIRSRMTVDGVVAVIDGPAVAEGRFADDLDAVNAMREEDPSFDHDNPLQELYEDQLMAADIVVLNKTDLLESDRLPELREEVAVSAGRSLRMIATREGAVDPAILLGLGSAAEDDLESRPSHHDGEEDHEHDDFESFEVTLGEVSSPTAFAERLACVAAEHDILRIKGFAAVAGKPMRLAIQGVGRRVNHHFDRPWTSDESGDSPRGDRADGSRPRDHHGDACDLSHAPSVREAHSLDEIDSAVDLGQSPADMVFLSFADTDLAAATVACRETAKTFRLYASPISAGCVILCPWTFTSTK